ncbi:class I SAM-dependent methyltransferase [Fimbriiglobus ruber]|uniref:Methyltransferase type 11 n=1 Tax=Fimbriiglobus ruber TaxID=1908690 RepID=A0A225DD95_9BACT|nr:class I SAM-dependent methyltransferase [Fimbriiglobus ruber]OWK35296.1 Methyltransferase type 11 [Fimbriiglobus ruber]
MADQASDYDAYQESFHKAFRAELQGILDALPIPGDGDVLDVPCGNGFYTRRLTERMGPGGRLTAVDASGEYLRRAREAVAGSKAEVKVRKANAYKLPFPDGTFDLVWCAQSLISLDPDRAVREMFRVVKRSGVVAILEVDEFHHVLLPLPVELEAAMPLAVQAASLERYGDGKKLAPARGLRRVLKNAKFRCVRRVTYPFDRAAPFDLHTTAFLKRHVDYLRSFAYPHLPAPMQAVFDRVTDPGKAKSLFRLTDAEVVCINAVYLASV